MLIILIYNGSDSLMNSIHPHLSPDDVNLEESFVSEQGRPLISVIVPFFNEEEVLSSCHQRLCSVLKQVAQDCHAQCEILYIDDGSSDHSWKMLLNINHSDCPEVLVRAIKLSRNFGKEAAMCAGLDNARGQCVVILDADLQDPPELIPQMLKQWRRGFDVVDMQRTSRSGESWFKCHSARLYYKLINHLSEIEIPENVGDFRLIDRKVVDALARLPERTRYMKGLFAWPGFKRTILPFDRSARLAGTTKWQYSKLFHLAFEGITSFSTKPLRIATMAGLVASLCATVMAIVVVIKAFFYGDPVAGYPTMVSIILLLGGMQLLAIGLIGEYLGRLFIEAKQRPIYLTSQDIELSASLGKKR